jgi:2-(1,2-epoxy-1,2-dihydrophenyl)acetyl-CoA isomerase
MAEDVLLVDSGPITRFTLNRPRAHNAIDTELGDRLHAALLTAGRDPEVKVIILRGNGRSFCSGDDRNEATRYHNDDIEAVGLEAHGYYQLMKAIRRVPQAVIAQVHGYCLGSGMDLLLAADFAVADAEARLGMVFGARGIMGGSVFLPRYVGLKHANRLLFDPEFMSAEQALELGLLTAVARPGELETEVEALAERLASGAAQHYAYFGLVKETINRALFPTLEDDVRMQTLMTRLGDFYRLTHPTEPDPGSTRG